MPWWRRGQAVTAISIKSPTLRSFRLSLDGWSEQAAIGGKEPMRIWKDADGDALSVSRVMGHLFTHHAKTPETLRSFTRNLACAQSAGLIEADPVELPFGPGIQFIYKKLERPAYLFHGNLICARHVVELFIDLVCRERGMTGVREAVVTAELFDTGVLDLAEYQRSFAQDPYDASYDGVDRSVLRFMSDDQKYDFRFPDHPLSKVRRVLRELPGAMSFETQVSAK